MAAFALVNGGGSEAAFTVPPWSPRVDDEDASEVFGAAVAAGGAPVRRATVEQERESERSSGSVGGGRHQAVERERSLTLAASPRGSADPA